jgi:hypothetical protein
MTAEQAAVLESVKAGCSIDEAARQAGKPVATVRRWLMEGRKRPDGKHGEFARAVDEARGQRRQAERALEGPLSRDEAELLLAKAARKGSVPALRLWFEQRAAGESKQRGDGARELLGEVFG